MRFRFDHDLHIHSMLSACSNDPEQSTQRILDYALKYGLNTVCITDHFWDETVEGASDWYKPQNFPWISLALPLPKAEGVKFLFGCETDMDKYLTVGISKPTLEKMDFAIIPTTHLHMKGFTLTEEDALSLERRAELWAVRFGALLDKDLPFRKIGVAHLACRLIANTSREDYLAVLEMISDDTMDKLFAKAAGQGIGIELNSGDMSFADDEADSVLRMFRIAKKQGCKFYCGSDAHHPAGLENAPAIFERAIDYLGLTEDDKFHIEGV